MAKSAKRQYRAEKVLPQQSAVRASRPAWRRHAWRLLAIWGLVLAAYSNSFQSGLVFDNSSIIAQDPRIRRFTLENAEAILTGHYRFHNSTDGLYRPATTFSYLLNYAIFGNGTRPAGYHWFNLAVHEVNAALVYALGIAIFGESAPAWALAAIWGVHPLLIESVTNIVGRADLLAAFGVLAGLLCHVRAASAGGRRKWAWLAGVLAAQSVGLFSKESAVVLPAIMLLYDLTKPGRVAWRVRAPSCYAVTAAFAAYLIFRAKIPGHMVIPFADNPLVSAGFWTARLTAVKAFAKSVELFLWPARLSADYSYNALPVFGRASGWEDAKALIALAALLGGAIFAVLFAVRRGRAGTPMLFFLAFFFVAALPTSNLIVLIGSIFAERFSYLPSVGMAGFLVAAAYGLVQRGVARRPWVARGAWATTAILCLALAARSYARNFDWKDELSLWSSAVDVCPDSSKAHYNLAKALEALPGRLPEAIAEYRIGLRIYPDDAQAHTNLGNALTSMPGGIPEAIAEYQAAIRINPDSAEPHNDLGNVLSDMPGRLPEAIAEYRTALRIQNDNAEVHYNLANALLRQPGGEADVIAEYQSALRIDPGHADAHLNLGNALSGIPGRTQDAIAEYHAVLRIQPDSVRAHINLANTLLREPGGLPEAIAEYRAALRIQPGNAEAHYDLATALERIPRRLPDAIAEYQAALRSAPDFFEAHVNLGNALAQSGGRDAEAIAEYDAALRIKSDPVVQQIAARLRAGLRNR